MIALPRPWTKRCALCGKPIVCAARGRTPTYCTDAHQQVAYRLRTLLPTTEAIHAALGDDWRERADRARYLLQALRGRMGDAYRGGWRGSAATMPVVARSVAAPAAPTALADQHP